jgi:hypothetical protein
VPLHCDCRRLLPSLTPTATSPDTYAQERGLHRPVSAIPSSSSSSLQLLCCFCFTTFVFLGFFFFFFGIFCVPCKCYPTCVWVGFHITLFTPSTALTDGMSYWHSYLNSIGLRHLFNALPHDLFSFFCACIWVAQPFYLKKKKKFQL